jgi:hypothetical protein
MQALERRISVLEKHVPTNFNKVLVVAFNTPGLPDGGIHKLRSAFGVEDCQQWVRDVNESEHDFIGRAKREVVRSDFGTALLFKTD